MQDLRQAETRGDWQRVKLCLLRLNLVKRGYDKPCPHCGVILTGVGAWPDTLSTSAWAALVAVYVKGYITSTAATTSLSMAARMAAAASSSVSSGDKIPGSGVQPELAR
jgi:hypothetical protein